MSTLLMLARQEKRRAVGAGGAKERSWVNAIGTDGSSVTSINKIVNSDRHRYDGTNRLTSVDQ